MLAYHFDCFVDDSRAITLQLPADAPTGLVQLIVLFPDAPLEEADTKHGAVGSGQSGNTGPLK